MDSEQFDPQIDALVSAELERIKPLLGDKMDKLEFTNNPETPGWVEGCVRIRMDYEIVDEEIESDEHILMVILTVLHHELCDLLEYGDTDNSHDLFLTALNGKHKRGADLKSVTVNEIKGYTEHGKNKGITEYTWYILFTPEWS